MIKPDGTRVAFVYDNLQRLISAGVAGAAETRRTYSYGAFSTVGNLTNAASAAGTANAVTQRFTYDSRDQMTGASQDANALGAVYRFDYTYDVLGRRTLTSDLGGARTSYGYDLADRLISVNAPSGRVIALAYDDGGRRTSVAYPNGLTTSAAFETPQAANGATGRLALIAHGLTATGPNRLGAEFETRRGVLWLRC